MNATETVNNKNIENNNSAAKLGHEDLEGQKNSNSFRTEVQNTKPEDSKGFANTEISSDKETYGNNSEKAPDAYDEIADEKVKTMRAAIMARNMSHNIGSHVMSYLRQQLTNTGIIQESIFVGNKDKKISEIDNMPFLVGLGHFLGYLQERQDYIATVATDYIPYGSPVDFKEAIYDGLTPDLRWKRHSLSGRKPQNHLLELIAKSEGFSDPNSNNQGSINLYFAFDNFQNGKWEEIMGHETKDIANMRGISLAIPGGIVGRQAIFSIVENIIRNAAKHESKLKENKLDLTLGLIDGKNVHKTEGLSKKLRDQYKEFIGVSDYFLLTISFKTERTEEEGKTLVRQIRKGLQSPFIEIKKVKVTTKNEDSSQKEERTQITYIPNSENKGLKEIRISAAWLRRDYLLDVNRIKNSNEENNILEYNEPFTYTSPYKKGENSLECPPLVAFEFDQSVARYVICIPKEVPIAFVSDGYNEKELEEIKRACKEQEWHSLTKEDLIKSHCIYEIVIVADDCIEKEIRPKYTSRVVVCAGEEICKIIKNKPEDTLLYVLSKYTNIQYIGEFKTDDNTLEKIHIEDSENPHKNNISREEGQNKEDNTINMWEGNYQEELKKIIVFSDSKNDEKPKYLYRKHHDSEYQISNYLTNCNKGGLYEETIFVESITGSNSTDRIIRREPYSFVWYYLHLYAMKSKVLIFDERLFKSIHQISDQDVLGCELLPKKMNDFLEKISKVGDGTEEYHYERNQFVKELYYMGVDGAFLDQLYGCKKRTDIENVIKDEINNLSSSHTSTSQWTLIRKWEPSSNDDKQIVTNKAFEKAITYIQRGIDIFNIIKEDDKLLVVGYVYNSQNLSITYKTIATIEKGGKKDIVKIMLSQDPQKYGYISIHQGILDKIYELLDIKGNDKEQNNVTKKIYSVFTGNEIPEKGDFLPNIVIHSGRSKPDGTDMPQPYPFIQYAALEHAVNDSKYTLVQLFDFAKYE